MSRNRIFQVTNFRIRLTEGKSPVLHIEALGRPSSAGWSEVALVPLEKELSDDGILDLELVGKPPAKTARKAGRSFPVSASTTWTKDAGSVVGIALHGRTNTLTRLFADAGGRTKSAFTMPGGGIDQPAPTDVGIEDITFGEGEDAPTLGEDPTDVMGEDLPTFFDEGEEPPTLGESPTDVSVETAPSFFEQAENPPTDGEAPPTDGEDPPTSGEEDPPTFAEQPTNPWVDVASLPEIENPTSPNPNLEGPSNPIVENPPSPWWENDPGSWPGPFEDPAPWEQSGSSQQGTIGGGYWTWVRIKGRWQRVWVARFKKMRRTKPGAFGRW